MFYIGLKAVEIRIACVVSVLVESGQLSTELIVSRIMLFPSRWWVFLLVAKHISPRKVSQMYPGCQVLEWEGGVEKKSDIMLCSTAFFLHFPF